MQIINKNNQRDIQILRELAKKYSEIASDEKQDKRRELWRNVNSFRNTGIPIYMRGEVGTGWVDEVTKPLLQCEDPFFREHEYDFRFMIFQDILDDDYIIEPWITQRATYVFPNDQPWGIEPFLEKSAQINGSYRIHPPIKDLEDVQKLVVPQHRIDEEQTKRNVEKISDAVGDLVTINVDRSPFYNSFEGDISSQMAYLRGIENIMNDVYENESWFKELLKFVADGIANTHEQAEAAGDWNLTAHFNQAMAYCHELEDPKANTPVKSRKELWGYMAAQEYTLISPEQTYEFLLKYQIPILEHFGLTAYACCEDITKKIPVIKKIPNLRRIGITAFSDIEKCAEQIGGDYVCSWRPSPARTVCIGFDEENVRKILREGIDIMRRNNCVFDITSKDMHTIGGDISRLTRFVKIAREEINR